MVWVSFFSLFSGFGVKIAARCPQVAICNYYDEYLWAKTIKKKSHRYRSCGILYLYEFKVPDFGKSSTVLNEFVTDPDVLDNNLSFSHIREIMVPIIKVKTFTGKQDTGMVVRFEIDIIDML